MASIILWAWFILLNIFVIFGAVTYFKMIFYVRRTYPGKFGSIIPFTHFPFSMKLSSSEEYSSDKILMRYIFRLNILRFVLLIMLVGLFVWKLFG
jgi:hypothetical protein